VTTTTHMGDPGSTGRFGEFGGRYVPETLVPACQELEAAFRDAWADPRSGPAQRTPHRLRRPSLARSPSAHRLSEELGIRLVLLKREDLNHTGSHKINNVLGQALLAKRMGKTRLVAETGAGQHGVASATAAALMGLECKVYMGAVDVARQELNVFRMRLLGTEVRGRPQRQPHPEGRGQRGDARLGGHRRVDTHYCLGSVMGPHPYPWMVREFHRVIGDEARMSRCESSAPTPTW
jgi:tryptophan synthase beta chain